jgi:hypothetical protein
MKKPDGKAEAGWYDAPEIDGYLQYWNGKFWTKKKQIKDGFENLEVLPEYELGKFFFRKPFTSDNVFIGWAVLNGLVAIGRFSSNSKQGFDTSNAFSIITGIGDAVFGTIFLAIFTWIFFLLYLLSVFSANYYILWRLNVIMILILLRIAINLYSLVAGII